MTDTTTNVTDRLTTLTVESTQTFMDGWFLIQRQNAQIVQNVFSAIEGNQKPVRELTGQFLRQTQEAQQLWLDYTRDAFRNTVDTVTHSARAQMEQVGQGFEKVNREVKNGAKKAEAAK